LLGISILFTLLNLCILEEELFEDDEDLKDLKTNLERENRGIYVI